MERKTNNNLLIYQKYMDLIYYTNDLVRKFPKSEKFALVQEIKHRYISDKALLQFTKKLIFENRPFNTPQGIPIGNYTSQYFANIYLNELDQYVKRTLHIHEYVRYMDDFIILQKDKTSCINLMQVISRFLKTSLNLELNHKSKYYPNKMGVNFCGYRIFSTHKLLRNSSKKKIKRHVKKWNKAYKANSFDFDKTMLRLNSLLGHSSHSNSYNLQQKILAKCDFLLNDKAYDKFEKNILDDLSNLS